MRRTSRLLVLFGIGLAVLTFVLILSLGIGGPPTDHGNNGPTPSAPVNVTVVVAGVDIPLGTVVTADMLKTQTVPATSAAKDSYPDPSLVIGNTARHAILTGAQVRATYFALSQNPDPLDVPPGTRAMAISTTELTGVGKLIHAGDTVDVVMTFDEAAIKVVTLQPPDKSPYGHDDSLRPVTVKAPALLQDIRVIGTIDSPVEGATASHAPTTNTLTGTTKLIILAVTDDQAEAILFARTAGTIDLVLRSPVDEGTTAATDGVILKTMFDKYGVLPPFLIKAIDAYVPQQP